MSLAASEFAGVLEAAFTAAMALHSTSASDDGSDVTIERTVRKARSSLQGQALRMVPRLLRAAGDYPRLARRIDRRQRRVGAPGVGAETVPREKVLGWFMGQRGGFSFADHDRLPEHVGLPDAEAFIATLMARYLEFRRFNEDAAEMNDRFCRFVIDLAQDARRRSAFLDDPEAFLATAPLSPLERAALASGDWRALSERAIGPGRELPPRPFGSRQPPAGLRGKPCLTIVGTGIALWAHVSQEALEAIRQADRLLYLVADPFTVYWLGSLNTACESLADCYQPGLPRREIYQRMADRALGYLRDGQSVCLAFYGHPGFFVHPTTKTRALARAEGFPVIVQPGISSLDCLTADLEIDYPSDGAHLYEATDFLVRRRPFDPSVHLILFQIGLIGSFRFRPGESATSGLSMLRDVLLTAYPPGHRVAIYQAAASRLTAPEITWVGLQDLHTAECTHLSTLYIPPARSAAIDPEMRNRLGIEDL